MVDIVKKHLFNDIETFKTVPHKCIIKVYQGFAQASERKVFVKRIISIIAVLALVLGLLVGCGGDGDGDTASTPNGVNDGIFSTDTVKLADANGEAVYNFVRAEGLSADATAKALTLFSTLKKDLGLKSLKNMADSASDGIDKYEILVGQTNRTESAQALEHLRALNNRRSHDFIIATIGKKIVINAFTDEAVMKAVDYFIANYVKATVEGGIKYTSLTAGDYADVKINGAHISQFKIIRPQYNSSYLTQMQIDALIDDADKTYTYLVDCVDDKQKAGEYEIIVGNADREGVSAVLDRDEFKITVSGKKVYLNGGSVEATAMAVSEFAKLLKNGNITDADTKIGSYAQTVASYDKSKYYTFAWGDDFDGDEIDTTKWRVVPDGPYNNKGMNGRRSIRTDDPQYVYVKDGHFHIDAAVNGNDYIGGMLMTYNSMIYRYGYLEMSAILPHGDGFWTALWVDSRGHSFNDVTDEMGLVYDAEIDVNECFGNANVVAANVHKWPNEQGTEMGYQHTSLDGSHGNEKKHYLAEGETFNNTFHTFGFLWDEDEHTFTCDGQVYFSYKNNETEENRDGLHLLSFIRLSAAIGFETQGVIEPDDSPAWHHSNKLIADYVYIYQLQDGKHLLHTK